SSGPCRREFACAAVMPFTVVSAMVGSTAPKFACYAGAALPQKQASGLPEPLCCCTDPACVFLYFSKVVCPACASLASLGPKQA
ncbi:hypothetical protein, partial [Acetobacter orientalis]|uniref:hypothetical protein n=1 Tax=Acetobacter orientalis TaxID=146474 RepID=UPI0039E7E500